MYRVKDTSVASIPIDANEKKQVNPIFKYAVFGNRWLDAYLQNTHTVLAAENKSAKVIAVIQRGTKITHGTRATMITPNVTSGIRTLGFRRAPLNIFEPQDFK